MRSLSYLYFVQMRYCPFICLSIHAYCATILDKARKKSLISCIYLCQILGIIEEYSVFYIIFLRKRNILFPPNTLKFFNIWFSRIFGRTIPTNISTKQNSLQHCYISFWPLDKFGHGSQTFLSSDKMSVGVSLSG